MGFKSPFYYSEFVSLTQSFPFVKYTETFVEAVADMPLTVENISFPYISRSDESENPLNVSPGDANEYPILYRINFKFNPIFGNNPYYQGFENYRNGSPYLIRIDLNFINNPVAAAVLNRTFFLLDDRAKYTPYEGPSAADLTTNQAKYYTQDGKRVVTRSSIYTDWIRPDETLENYDFRAARVAQFPYISNITDSAFMDSARNPSKAPFEIRPYYVDINGKNSTFVAEDVTWPTGSADPRVLLPGGVQCYQKDWRYIDYLDIEFQENYNNPDSEDFATGSLVIPAKYFGFTNIENKEQFVGSLKNFVSIKAYAKPLLTDLEPQNWNEIIFVSSDDIIVERVRSSTITG